MEGTSNKSTPASILEGTSGGISKGITLKKMEGNSGELPVKIPDGTCLGISKDVPGRIQFVASGAI